MSERGGKAEETRARIIAHKMDRCRHFSYELGIGGRGPVCAVGVSLAPSEPRRPCVEPRDGLSCNRREPFTRAEAEARADAVEAAITRITKAFAEGRCHVCEKPVERQRQVGRCIYAEPCGHRLGQGDAQTPPPPRRGGR